MSSIFGRPFVKRFALCYRTVVCLSYLSVTLVYCGQTVGWIKIPLGMEVRLGPLHTVLDGDPAPPQGSSSTPKRGHSSPPTIRPMSIVAMARWIEMPLCTSEVGLSPGHIVLDGDPAPPERGKAPPPTFRPMCIVAKRLDAPGYHLIRR